MSATFDHVAPVARCEVQVSRGVTNASVRLPARLTVGEASSVRRAVADALGALPFGGRGIVDLGEVTELDAAGLAAVTSPVFANRRRGCRITVLPPTTQSAARFARIVGVLPIGVD